MLSPTQNTCGFGMLPTSFVARKTTNRQVRDRSFLGHTTVAADQVPLRTETDHFTSWLTRVGDVATRDYSKHDHTLLIMFLAR